VQLKRDVERAVEAMVHSFHCWFFDDAEWCLDDYVDLYGPLVLFIAFEVSILVIAGIVN